MKEPVLLAWSGGKDSAMALHELLRSGQYDITLLTTLTEDYRRISMHGIREDVLEAQAVALGLPLAKVWIPAACANEVYGARMAEALETQRARGCGVCFFGDIFLADVRAYREQHMALAGMRAEFPLWGSPPRELADAFVRQGFKAAVACVDTQALPAGFAGREYDEAFIRSLPRSVDVCGENGEFHTCVYDSPDFRSPLPLQRGETVLREQRFSYCDLFLAEN